MIKTMKSRLFITVLLAVLTLGVTTSCEDMFDIPSNRVVYDHEINSTADSAYTTLGVLHLMRKVADRYVILGELRGDIAQIDEVNAKASLRNLANFNFGEANEYLNVRDYYNIINNCNYALENMDISIKLHNEYVMMDEYAALISIRAWTYLQLAINYGDVYYYTYPVISEADVQRVKAEGKKSIEYITADLAPQMLPYLDVNMPSFVSTTGSYPNMRLVLAELYLWSGEYEKAVELYEDYFMHNEKYELTKTDAENDITETEPGYFEFSGAFGKWNGIHFEDMDPIPSITLNKTKEFIAGIPMETSSSSGVVSEVSSLFHKGSNGEEEMPPMLKISHAYEKLCKDQKVFNVSGTGKDISIKVDSVKMGDMRKYAYVGKTNIKDEMTGLPQEYDTYVKHSAGQIVIQRYPIACLRWAEAMNALARKQLEAGNDSVARVNAVNSFYLLKDAFKVFFPDSTEVWTRFVRFHDDLKKSYIGIHGRGAGDVAYDTVHYVLKPNVIAERLGRSVSEEDEQYLYDVIEYIDELIIDELALESTLEGNRFGDLVRFAKRREEWGDGNYLDFLAKRVANRGEEKDEELYSKLLDDACWYLPFK